MISFVLFCALAWLLWSGLGALVARIAEGREPQAPLPRSTWPALGVAACSLLALDLAKLGLTAPIAPLVVAACGVVGLGFAVVRLRSRRPDWRVIVGAGLPVLAIFGWVFASYGLTLTGYLVDTTAGVQVQGADYLMTQGGDFAAAPSGTSVDDMLRRYFYLSSYPAGSHATLGTLSVLSGTDALTLYSPLMAVLLSVTACAFAGIIRDLGGSRATAVAGGALGTCGALVVSYALMGSIKELVLLPQLAALSALVIAAPRLSRRALLIPLALVCGAAYATVGVAAAGWMVPGAGLVLIRTTGGTTLASRGRGLAIGAVSLALLGGIAAGPLLPTIANQITLATALSQTNEALAADPGNLFRPLRDRQMLGIWFAPEHRVRPEHHRRNDAFLLVAAGLTLVGLLWLIRRRPWAALWFGALGLIWFALTQRGTIWIDAKLLMLMGPFLAVLMVLGAEALSRRLPRRGLAYAALLAPLVVGVAYSDLTLVRNTGTAPMERYRELRQVNERFAGKGPALLTEFDEYALSQLDDVRATGLSFVEHGDLEALLTDGRPVAYGDSYDVDLVAQRTVQRFPLVVGRTSPLRSAPPSNYRLAWRGRFWTAYQRVAAAPRSHKSVGTDTATGPVPCPEPSDDPATVVRVARSQTLTLPISAAQASESWATLPGIRGNGWARATIPEAARRQRWSLWLDGTTPRDLLVRDQSGRLLGRLPHRAGGNGNIVGPLLIPEGVSSLTLSTDRSITGVGDQSPGLINRLLLAPPEAPRVVRAGALSCQGAVAADWIDRR